MFFLQPLTAPIAMDPNGEPVPRERRNGCSMKTKLCSPKPAFSVAVFGYPDQCMTQTEKSFTTFQVFSQIGVAHV